MTRDGNQSCNCIHTNVWNQTSKLEDVYVIRFLESPYHEPMIQSPCKAVYHSTPGIQSDERLMAEVRAPYVDSVVGVFEPENGRK